MFWIYSVTFFSTIPGCISYLMIEPDSIFFFFFFFFFAVHEMSIFWEYVKKYLQMQRVLRSCN